MTDEINRNTGTEEPRRTVAEATRSQSSPAVSRISRPVRRGRYCGGADVAATNSVLHRQPDQSDLPVPRIARAPVKVAHLFLIGWELNQPVLWDCYFRESQDRHNVYVHPKYPEKVTDPLLASHVICDLKATRYGHISLIEAELALLRAALSDPQNGFFLLHSESCVPLLPYASVYEMIVATGKSWLRYYQGSMERHRLVDRSAVPREHFYKASQFVCLTRRHVEIVVSQRDLSAWRNSWAADEHFIPTTLSKCGALPECARQWLTFAHWDAARRETAWGPATFHRLSQEDVELLSASGCPFARKFASDSDVAEHFRNGRLTAFPQNQ